MPLWFWLPPVLLAFPLAIPLLSLTPPVLVFSFGPEFPFPFPLPLFLSFPSLPLFLSLLLLYRVISSSEVSVTGSSSPPKNPAIPSRMPF